MMYIRAQITRKLIEYFENDDRRIEHALRVLYHAEKFISETAECDAEIVIAAALLHDVGIKISEQKLGYNTGKTQERYGSAIAEKLLRETNFPEEKIPRVIDIIGRHHSPASADDIELTLLKKADAIVNTREKV